MVTDGCELGCIIGIKGGLYRFVGLWGGEFTCGLVAILFGLCKGGCVGLLCGFGLLISWVGLFAIVGF